MSEVEGGSSVSAGWWKTRNLLDPEAAGRGSSSLSGPGFLPRHGNACAWALQLLPLGQRQWLELVACPCLGVRTTVAAGEPGRRAGPRGHEAISTVREVSSQQASGAWPASLSGAGSPHRPLGEGLQA